MNLTIKETDRTFEVWEIKKRGKDICRSIYNKRKFTIEQIQEIEKRFFEIDNHEIILKK